MSEDFPLRNLSSSSLFLLSLSLVLVGSSGGDVEPKDRSGNSVKEKNRVNTYVALSILKKLKKYILFAKESYFLFYIYATQSTLDIFMYMTEKGNPDQNFHPLINGRKTRRNRTC
jgi:hypothetical protein